MCDLFVVGGLVWGEVFVLVVGEVDEVLLCVFFVDEMCGEY